MSETDNEDESDPDAISPRQKERAESSPIPGCIILSTILAVFGGLAILYTVVGFYQHKERAKFLDPEPAEIRVLEPTATQIEQAENGLISIVAAATQNHMDRVTFTAENLNTLIATREKLSGFRGNTFVQRITPGGIEVEMSQPVKKAVLSKELLYLNGLYTFQPELRKDTVAFKFIDIQKDGVEIPEDFKAGFSAIDNLLVLDPEDEILGPVMKKLKRVYLEDGKLVLETKITNF